MVVRRRPGGARTAGFAIASLIVGGACRSADGPANDPAVGAAAVVFELNAPLCSSRLPVQFLLDGHVVGTDTFTVHLAPNHTTSREYTTSAGRHAISARVISGYLWPDSLVTLRAGQRFVDTLPFYCS